MAEHCTSHGVSRRGLLRSGALAGLVTTVGAPTFFDPASADASQSQTITGTFAATNLVDWHYLPVEVPAGVNAIEVSYDYDHTGYGLPNNLLGNALDIGIWDPSGTDLGNAAGFRGWSGGARSSFRISNGDATPGYLAGPIDAGTWHVALGPYSVAPTGMSWTVTVTLTYGDPGPAYVPVPAPRSIAGAGSGWYRGDMHIHSVHSDGKRTLAQVAAAAQAAGLDFIASTDHNTSSAGLDWGRWAPDDLLVINGEEVTTRGGHWLALGIPAGTWIDWRYRVTDNKFRRFADLVRSLGGVVGAAHPYAPFPGETWTFGYGPIDVVEVWNGPWSTDDEASLATWHALLVAGNRLPAVGDSDAHGFGDTIGLPQNVVRADSLSVGDVLDGVRTGRSWLAESSAVDLTFTATAGGRVAQIGEKAAPGPVHVDLEVTGAPGCIAVVVSSLGPVALAQADASGRITLSRSLGRVGSFLRVEVRRPTVHVPTTLDELATWAPVGPMVALTNPIWLSGPLPGS